MPSPVPSHPRITTPFGKPGSWAAGFHTGEDYGSPGVAGARVVATRAGTVIYSGSGGGWGAAYGNHVIIESDGVQHMYAHLASRSATYGQRISAGQAVGSVGNTGRSFGPHLHYEERTSPYRYGPDSRRPQFSSGGGDVEAASAPPEQRRFGAYAFEENRRAHRALQRRLHERGHDPQFGEWPTTFFGTGTRAAVAAFQRAQGWSGSDADGMLGPATLDRLGLPRRWRFRSDKRVDASAMVPGTADSDSVWNVQVALMLEGYSIPAGPTDYSGDQTAAAVREFWARNGWTDTAEDGRPDQRTVAALGLTWVEDEAGDRPAGPPTVTEPSGGRAPGAVWDPVAGFDGLRPFASGGGPKIVLHTTEGAGKPDWAALGSGIPHFTVDLDDDVVWQHLPLDVAAYTLRGGEHSPNSAGGVAIQVEIVGRAADTAGWSRARHERLGRLVRWIADTIGAQVVAPFPFTGSDGAGLGGSVRQSWERYRESSGVVGHAHVPYNDHWDPGRLDVTRLLDRRPDESSQDAQTGGADTSQPGPATVTLVTFNVPERYRKGGPMADTALLTGLMAECDVMGLQEAGWAEGLAAGLGWTVHRPLDSTGTPVGQLLLWDPDVWETVDLGTTLMSEATRVQPKAAGPTLHREKQIVWADLRHRDSDQVWNLACVHFVPSKHLGGQTRRLWTQQLEAVVAWMGRQGPRAVVLGDFNAQPDDALAQPLRARAHVQSAVSHGRRRIDWVVSSTGAAPVGKAQALDNRGQSDHRPVRAAVSG